MGKLKDMTLKKAFYLIVSVAAVIALCLSAVSVRTCSRIHDRITLSHAFRMDAAVFDYKGGGYCTVEVETGDTEAEDSLMEFTGRGFSEKERMEATDYFYKGKMEEGHSMEKKHFGIGLTICRILAQKHGGIILLDNSSEGGARVTVQIKTEEISSL